MDTIVGALEDAWTGLTTRGRWVGGVWDHQGRATLKLSARTLNTRTHTPARQCTGQPLARGSGKRMLGSWDGCSGVREGWHGAGVGAKGTEGPLGTVLAGIEHIPLGSWKGRPWGLASRQQAHGLHHLQPRQQYLRPAVRGRQPRASPAAPEAAWFRGGLSVGVVLRFQAFSFETAGCNLSGAK